MLIEHTWAVNDQATIFALRERWRIRREGVVALDPGAHGALAIQAVDRRTLLHPLGDERQGGMVRGIEMAIRARATVIVCETQFAPRAHPNMPSYLMNAKAAAAMATAKRAGLVIGYLAGRAGWDIDLVNVQPGTWQSWVLEDLEGRATRDVLKEEATKLATLREPEAMKAIPRGEDREGAADAWGLLQFWITHPMRPSPVR